MKLAKKKKKGRKKKKGTSKARFPMTVVVDLNKDGKPDVVRVYKRKKGSNKTLVANVKLGTTEMGSKKKKRR